MPNFKRFLDAEDGVTSVEYALVALLVALAILTTAALLGVNLGAIYDYVAGKFPALPN
jgi:pilus assembly protein Flp/PilA